MSNHLMTTYAPLPVAFEKGQGAWLWDTQGRRVLDAISGLGVCALGHAHPDIAQAVADQASRLIHTGNLVHIPEQEELAGRLVDIAGMERAFFGNSGAEAIECAVKLARLHGHAMGIEQPAMIVMESSFHGRTMAALSATGSHKAQAGFEPLVGGFIRAPYGDADAVAGIAGNRQDVAAVLVEPIQGEAGIRVPPADYLARLRAICDRNGWLLIFDEIQSGVCRTGRWYAHQHDGVSPDVMTSAKALASGLPIGACLARGQAAELFQPGQHGSTFGGNHLVCRAALTTLEVLERDRLADNATAMGKRILGGLCQRIGRLDCVTDIRGRGLMIGVELDRDVSEFRQIALDRGVLLNVTQSRVVRLLPPLIIDEDQADIIVDTVCDLVESLD